MKKTIIICASALCIFLISCSRTDAGLFKDPPTKAITVLFDDTDPMAVRPTSSDIVSIFGFSNEDAYMGYDLRLRSLSAVNLTDIYEEYLPAQNKLAGNEMRRVAQIKSFRRVITNKLELLNKKQSKEQEFSVLYRTIAQELNHLAQEKADTKICLIYSDLEENSQDADFVSKKGYNDVRKYPLAVASHLEKVVKLNDLSGIEIRIVFKPTSHAQELKFNADLEVFRSIFLSHNAKVTVSANPLNQ